MLTELNWQLLDERRRIARLVMFYKMVAITMPLKSKMSSSPSRTANSLAYSIPASQCDYHPHSFFPRTVRECYFLPQPIVQLSTPEAFRSALSSVKSGSRHSTALPCSEWESHPILEEPEVHFYFNHLQQH